MAKSDIFQNSLPKTLSTHPENRCICKYYNNYTANVVEFLKSQVSRFNARYWMLGAGALGQPRGMEWGGRTVQDGEHMYTCGGFILIFGKTNTVM